MTWRASCEFCTEFYLDPPEEGSRVLLNSSNFLVVADASPLVYGHVLILPRRHLCSMSRGTPEMHSELAALVSRTMRELDRQVAKPLLFEHGMGSDAAVGCGVTHAHIHALPLASPQKRLIVEQVGAQYPLTDYPHLCDALAAIRPETSYLMVTDNDDRWSVADNCTTPSQFMRKLVAEACGIAGWDWRRRTHQHLTRAIVEGISIGA